MTLISLVILGLFLRVVDKNMIVGFAILQSFIHILLTFASVTLLVASFTKNAALSFSIQTYYPIVADVYCFSAPICLFLTRWAT